MLKSGSKVPVLRLLLQAKSWLECSEQRILSDSFLVPLLLWIQTRQSTWFSTLAENLIQYCQPSEDLITLLNLPLEESSSEYTSSESEMDIENIQTQIDEYRKALEEKTKLDNQPTRLIEEIKSLDLNS